MPCPLINSSSSGGGSSGEVETTTNSDARRETRANLLLVSCVSSYRPRFFLSRRARVDVSRSSATSAVAARSAFYDMHRIDFSRSPSLTCKRNENIRRNSSSLGARRRTLDTLISFKLTRLFSSCVLSACLSSLTASPPINTTDNVYT